MCDLFTCDIFLINAWRSNQNPSIYNQHKQCQLSDMLLTVWTHKQLDTVIYSTKVLAKWKSVKKKKKKAVKCNILNQPRFRWCFFMFMVHSAAGSHCTDNLVGGVMTHRVFVRLHQTVSFLLVNMFGRLGGEKKNLIWLEFDSILVKLWNETFKNKYILQSLVLYCILEVLLPRNQHCDPFKCI